MQYLLASAALLSLLSLSGCGFAWAQQPAAPKAAPAKAAPTTDSPPARQNPPPANNANRKPEDAKSPLVRSLLEQLNQFPNEGTADERGQIRDYLWEADEELARSLGPNAKKSILEANKRRPAFSVRTRKEAMKKKAAPPKTGEPTPAVPPLPEVKPPVVPPMPLPAPVKPVPKKADDDPFGM